MLLSSLMLACMASLLHLNLSISKSPSGHEVTGAQCLYKSAPASSSILLYQRSLSRKASLCLSNYKAYAGQLCDIFLLKVKIFRRFEFPCMPFGKRCESAAEEVNTLHLNLKLLERTRLTTAILHYSCCASMLSNLVS